MLIKYIQAAMNRARYEILSDNSYYGEIPDFNDVYSNEKTLEQCRNKLEEVLENWILFRVSKNLYIPSINKIKIKIRTVARD